MELERQAKFVEILRGELVPALGCTEPIAIAYASAKARETLGEMPRRMELRCSGNIIKNVKSVTVPNSGGMRGVGAAAVLGVVGGDAGRELQVLESLTQEQIAKAKQLLSGVFFTCKLQEGVENLYISVTVWSNRHSASVTIVNRHTLISEILYDGEPRYCSDVGRCGEAELDLCCLNVKDILEFADTVPLAEVEDILERQIQMNTVIAEAGLSQNFGSRVGRTLLDVFGEQVSVRARAYAAAGSDARMGGCGLPVVINSGSGNQGMTVSLPVIEYAKEWKCGREKLYRALLISNLVSIHQKYYIGSLSAFCGAVSAACGAGAAITYLAGGDYDAVCRTIVNTEANAGGIVCDGAKASCAAKISSAVDAAILGHHLSMRGLTFHPGDGIVQNDVEETMRSVGYVGRVGMRTTDTEILKIMLEEVQFKESAAG